MIYLGLGLIVLAWAFQTFAPQGKNKNQIQATFLLLYAGGASLLTWLNLLSQESISATFNGLTAILALISYLKKIN